VAHDTGTRLALAQLSESGACHAKGFDMPIDLGQLLAPEHTALITSEMQRGVIGDLASLPELGKAAAVAVPQVAALVEAAREAQVDVVHCTAERRADNRGANANARLFRAMAKVQISMARGSDAWQVIPEISVAESDIVLSRLHGLSPFSGTDLDPILRNLGVTTVVATGVSINVALQNLTFDLVNAGYQVVLPRDAVAGFPQEYVEMVFANTLGAVATLPTTAEVLAAWKR
jgi:nicotinamidase-related amidase